MEIGQKLFIIHGPGLGIGMTVAFFLREEKILDCKLQLQMELRAGAINRLTPLIICG